MRIMRRFLNEKKEAVWYEGVIIKSSTAKYTVKFEKECTRTYDPKKWSADFTSNVLRIVN
jgi:hypothetical protein